MAKQNLGQHFLKDRDIAKKIVNSITPFSGDILEIGPGRGVLTEEILSLSKNRKAYAVEKDPSLVKHLKLKFNKQIDIIEDSILNIKIAELSPEKEINIVGNIPYYISKEITEWIIFQSDSISKGVMLAQKEFFNKLIAPPSTGKYNPTGIVFNLRYKVKKLFDIKPGSFSPPPKVTSTLFHFERFKPEKLSSGMDMRFLRFLKIIFGDRRKTLLNNLRKLPGSGKDERAPNIPYKVNSKRAEQLDPEVLLKIFFALTSQESPEIL